MSSNVRENRDDPRILEHDALHRAAAQRAAAHTQVGDQVAAARPAAQADGSALVLAHPCDPTLALRTDFSSSNLANTASSNVAKPVVHLAPVAESDARETLEQQTTPVNIRDSSFLAEPQHGPAQDFGLTEEEGRRFLRIISDSLLIKRHYQLFVWLAGVRQFIPHEVFVSAWGNFAKGNLKIDVISSLPGVRTEQIATCQLHEVVESAHEIWREGGGEARIVKVGSVLRINGCECHVHAALRGMKSVLIHGVRDERGGYESVYMAFASGPQTQGRCKDKFVSLVNAIVPQIDMAFRKVAAYPLVAPREGAGGPAPKWLDLSTREQQILDWVCLGKKNVDIAGELGISHYTVKNHIQRIFKKIGASNRTQAAAKYNQTLGKFRRHAE